MADKNYGLTKKPNEHIKDKSADWMEEFFKSPTKEVNNKKEVEILKNINNIYDL